MRLVPPVPAAVLVGALLLVTGCGRGGPGAAAPAPATSAAGPAPSCAFERVDCVERDADVVPVASMLTAATVNSATTSRYRPSTNVRGSGTLSLCSGDNRPGTFVQGGVNDRYRAFLQPGGQGRGYRDLSQHVVRYTDGTAARRALAPLQLSAGSCSSTAADGPYYRGYSRVAGPAVGTGTSWFAVESGNGTGTPSSADMLAFQVDRTLVLLEGDDAAELAAVGREAARLVTAPPDGPLCDEAGCDDGEQHPAGLPIAASAVSRQPIWAALLQVASDADDAALTDAGERLRARGYTPDRLPLKCEHGAATALGRSEEDTAVTVHFPTRPEAETLLRVVGGQHPAVLVTPYCRE